MVRHLLILAAAVTAAARLTAQTTLPTITLTHDDTRISQSCEIRIPTDLVIADSNGNGVIQIVADGITVRFAAGSTLRGTIPDTPWNSLTGIGIRIEDHHGITLQNAQVHGFKTGLLAVHTPGLHVDGGDFSDNYRQKLASTPLAESGADWLYPHHNDTTKWRDAYGAALCIENSHGVTVRNVRVRRGQNGIVLDRVTDSRIFDNDCSFLSGWGLAMWRSSRNLVSRNAFDFCVRGHVEGVYNRGQDSAGILCFEQCNENIFAENSATHGGDGFFGFGGREAIGEVWMQTERERLQKVTGKDEVDSLIRIPEDLAKRLSALGSNRNLLIGNDFSYAAAHGIEMTFSEENQFINNRLVRNAICGVWGGYSSHTLIAGNEIDGNGGMAYGLERGGINIEHGAHNTILDNRFRNNKCAIHLWWDDDGALLKLPGVAGGEPTSTNNIIARNVFECDATHPFSNPDTSLTVLQLRDSSGTHLTNTYYLGNTVTLSGGAAREFDVPKGLEPIRSGEIPKVTIPHPTVVGDSRPVGARAALRGRERIIMDEWGPWDHESPLVRTAPGKAGEQRFDLFGFPSLPEITVLEGKVSHTLVPGDQGGPAQLLVGAGAGVTPFRIRLNHPQFSREFTGTLLAVKWKTTFFAWGTDPRTDLTGWRSLASQPEAIRRETDALDFPYGSGGPQNLKLIPAVPKDGPGPDHFGMIASTSLRLPKGSWVVRTFSDDGVRVRVDGRTILENWTWHGPTEDTGRFVQTSAGIVTIEVEHFEIDGYSVFRLEIEPEL
jgi:parallel beta-helix repeat protein